MPTRNLKCMSCGFFSNRLNVDEYINMLLKVTARVLEITQSLITKPLIISNSFTKIGISLLDKLL